MASEIRVDKINSLSGVGTVTLSPTGVDIAGITTAATLRATTGIVTSLTAGSLTSLGAVSGTTGTFSAAVSGTTGTFSAAVSGTTGTFSGAVSGTTGTFTGDVDIADKIIHTGDTNTAIRFPEADTITFETAGFEQVRIDNDVQMFVEANSKQAKLQLHREDTSVAADDVIGQITFTGRDSGGAGTQRVGAAISAIASNAWDTGQATGYSPSHLDFFTQNNSGVETTLTPRVRITSDGNVGINQAIPIAKFHVKGDSDNDGSVVLEPDSSKGNNISHIHHGSTGNWYIRPADSSGYIYHDIGKSQFTNGILFGSDTAASNTLDDYEEGTWTPTLASGTATTYLTQWYVKIGTLVTCYFYLYSHTDTTSSTHYRINGLPFAHATNKESFFHVSVNGNANLGSGSTGVYARIGVTGTTTQITFQRGFATTTASLTHAQVNTAHFAATFSYHTV